MTIRCRVCWSIFGFLLSVPVFADVLEGKPYMEAGVALVAQTSADYRGSHHYQPYGLPLPYFIYQGKIIKADKDGVRGEFWASHRFAFDVSVDGSLNGRSDNNKMRAGMDKLDSAFEMGPSFNANLTGATFSEGWSAQFPLRGVFTIGKGGVDYIGLVFNPRLTWRIPDVYWGWRASFNLGLLFANARYHEYYYDVAPEFATPGRPFYSSPGGYSGAFARLSVYKKISDWRVGVSVRYDNLGNVAFEDSPLMQTTHYASVSLGLVRTLWIN